MIDIETIKTIATEDLDINWSSKTVLELIHRLEAAESKQILGASARHFKQMEAADLIESQAAEIGRLRDIESEMLMIGVERAKNQFQDEIESQAAEIEKYKALCDQMGNALKTLWLAAPTDVDCNNMSHPKPKQHRYDETCPLVGEYHDAITGAGKALKAWRSMK